MSTASQRLVMFITGIITDLILTLYFFHYYFRSYSWLAVSGLQALIIFEIMHRTRNWVRIISLPLYFVLSLLLNTFTGNLLWGILYPDSSTFEYLWQLTTYIQPYPLLTAIIIVLLAYYLITGKLRLPNLGAYPAAIKGSHFIIGFLGWFFFDNLIILIMGPIGDPFLCPQGCGYGDHLARTDIGIAINWLLIIGAMAVFSKTRPWVNVGIVTAIAVNVILWMLIGLLEYAILPFPIGLVFYD